MVIYDKIPEFTVYSTNFLGSATLWTTEFATNFNPNQNYFSSDYKTNYSAKSNIKWIRWRKKIHHLMGIRLCFIKLLLSSE